MSDAHIDGVPRTAVVIGAGIVGLSTAWFLQDRGVQVTVVDRDDVAAGASWGNAGWISPGLSIPLPEPGVLKYGLRSLLDRGAPLYVPKTPDPGLWSFLTRFAAHCNMRDWRNAMQGYIPVNSECLDAYDVLTANGVDSPTHAAPIMAAFEKREQADDLRRELDLINQSGQETRFTEFSGPELREQVPQISDRIEHAIRLEGQRYVDPGQFVHALAQSVQARGATIRRGWTVTGIQPEKGGTVGTVVQSAGGDSIRAETVVLAAGSWASPLAKKLGVRVPVRAGRGYSFTVPTEEPVPGPIYLPAVRVACTPYQGKLRVAGSMEFRGADAPLDKARIGAVIASTRPLLDGISWRGRVDDWVGPRPVTPDGLPLVGATNTPGIFMAGGHGMWGLTLGPVTGRLLAERITTGKLAPELIAFDPLR